MNLDTRDGAPVLVRVAPAVSVNQPTVIDKITQTVIQVGTTYEAYGLWGLGVLVVGAVIYRLTRKKK